MTDWFGLATLVAALAAAVLSAASFFFSGRREDLRWKREVLEQTMVSLFDSSFNFADTAAFNARQAGESLEWHRERALDAHAVQMKALTRLRFLAKPKVLECAFELHDVEDQIYEAVFRKDVQLSQQQWNDLRERRRVARTNLFNAARRDLGLRPTVPLRPTVSLGPTGKEVIDHARKREKSGQ